MIHPVGMGVGTDAVGMGVLAGFDADENEDVFTPAVVASGADGMIFMTSGLLPLLDNVCTSGEMSSSSTVTWLDAGAGCTCC